MIMILDDLKKFGDCQETIEIPKNLSETGFTRFSGLTNRLIYSPYAKIEICIEYTKKNQKIDAKFSAPKERHYCS